MTDQKHFADCSSAVPVKAWESNGLRGSFPPQSSLGYEGMICLLMHRSYIADCVGVRMSIQSHCKHFCSHQTIPDWSFCKVASHNSVIDWHWIKLKQLDNGNGKYLIFPWVHMSFLPSALPFFVLFARDFSRPTWVTAAEASILLAYFSKMACNFYQACNSEAFTLLSQGMKSPVHKRTTKGISAQNRKFPCPPATFMFWLNLAVW